MSYCKKMLLVTCRLKEGGNKNNEGWAREALSPRIETLKNRRGLLWRNLKEIEHNIYKNKGDSAWWEQGKQRRG